MLPTDLPVHDRGRIQDLVVEVEVVAEGQVPDLASFHHDRIGGLSAPLPVRDAPKVLDPAVPVILRPQVAEDAGHERAFERLARQLRVQQISDLPVVPP